MIYNDKFRQKINKNLQIHYCKLLAKIEEHKEKYMNFCIFGNTYLSYKLFF